MITYGDLADQILNKDRADERLFCPACGAQYSANTGDYWNVPDDKEVYCECGEPMVLAVTTIGRTIIKQ